MPSTVPSSSVLEFYNDANVFITGGTGFLGKAIVDKLIRVCTNLNHIYLLIRVKRGKEPQARLKELFEDPLFERMRKERPDFEKKVTCIPGDVSEPRLGMSDDDYEFLTKTVSHVIHSAATVRFNERLKKAIAINVFGTHEMVSFCKECSKLKVLVHVSTAYAFCNRQEIDEELYPTIMTGEAVMSLSKTLTEERLHSLTTEIIKPWPNTYSFTKAVGEHILKEKGKSLPLFIFRPSIVMGSLKEPVPGWIDNIYGPTGVIAAVGAGVMRVLLADGSKVANLVPVDMVVNAILCSAWEVGTSFNNNLAIENTTQETKDQNESSKKVETDPKIYNFVSTTNNSVTWNQFLNLNLQHGLKTPSKKSIWYYTLTLTSNYFLYYILVLFLHHIPALIGDGILRLLGKKPQLHEAYHKIHTFTEAMKTFSLKDWKFSNNNVRELWSRLSAVDKELFFFDMSHIDWNDYFAVVILGIRNYIFKDPDDTLPAAKRKMFLLWLAHRFVQLSFLAGSFWVLTKLFYGTSFVFNMLFEGKT